MNNDLQQLANKLVPYLSPWFKSHSGTPVVASYSTDAGQTISNNTTTIVNFEDLNYDTHSAVTTGASWKFTAPIAGYYHVSSAVMFTATTNWAATEYASLLLVKNNTGYRYLGREDDHSTSNVYTFLGGSTVLYLAVNDYIDLRVLQTSGGDLALHNNGAFNYVSIHRIGS